MTRNERLKKKVGPTRKSKRTNGRWRVRRERERQGKGRCDTTVIFRFLWRATYRTDVEEWLLVRASKPSSLSLSLLFLYLSQYIILRWHMDTTEANITRYLKRRFSNSMRYYYLPLFANSSICLSLTLSFSLLSFDTKSIRYEKSSWLYISIVGSSGQRNSKGIRRNTFRAKFMKLSSSFRQNLSTS